MSGCCCDPILADHVYRGPVSSCACSGNVTELWQCVTCGAEWERELTASELDREYTEPPEPVEMCASDEQADGHTQQDAA